MGNFTPPEDFAMDELTWRVGQLEASEHKRITDLETRAICLEEVIHTLTQRLDLLTLELHHLKARS